MRIHRVLLLLPLAALCALVLTSAQSPAPAHLGQALDAQRALAEKHPDDPGIQNDLGNLLELAGDRLGAEQAYQRAIELDPEDPGPRFNYGLLLASTGRRKAALTQFRKVVDLDPGHAWAHYEIGAIWDAWGIERMARRSYARAFELDFQLADPRVNPDVLDNEEATAAMLLAWKRGTPAAGAPRDYSDASRIASLLIDVPEVAPEEELEEDELADDAEGGSGGGFARLASPPIAAPSRGSAVDRGDEGWQEEPDRSATESQPRVLDASALGSGRRPVNQISAPGAGSTSRSPGPTPRTNPRQRGRTVFGSRFGSTGQLEPVLRPVDDRGQVIAG